MSMSTIATDIVDFHAHILPTADHGSASLDVSLLQLKKADAYGIKRIVATPHFYPMKEDLDSFLKRRRVAYDMLMGGLDSDAPCIKIGAEVTICDGIDRLPRIDKLFINGTQTVLVELPPVEFQYEFAASVYRLTSSGINVVLAHPERYESYAVNAMIESGALLQCNASAIVRGFKIRRALPWIANKSVVAIGSDIHGMNFSAYKDFVKATKKLDDYVHFIKEYSDSIWNIAEFGLNN